jgi:hypothetical protein
VNTLEIASAKVAAMAAAARDLRCRWSAGAGVRPLDSP